MSKSSAEDLFNLSLVEDSKESKPKRRKKSRFFYEVANHQEFFKMAGSYYKDYKQGIKSFAFSSTGYHSSQQKCILGIASFFDHREDPNILIISENLDTGILSQVSKDSIQCPFPLITEEETDELFLYSFHDHFDLMNLNQLLKIEGNDDSELDKDEVIDQVCNSYDLILWDVPSLDKIQETPEFYYPMIMKIDFLSIIVSHARSKEKDITSVINFYSDYGIQLKGFLIDKEDE